MTTKCSACGIDLKPVFNPEFYPEMPFAKFDPYTGHDLETTIQFKDALAFTVHSGYGMYFDDTEEPHLVVICKDCVDNLREAVPWIDHLIFGYVANTNEGVSTTPHLQIVPSI